MLKELHLKFIVVNMAIVMMALMIAFGAICYIDYQSSLRSVYAAMYEAIEEAVSGAPLSEGGYCGDAVMAGGFGVGESQAPLAEGFGEDGLSQPEIGGHQRTRQDFIPVAVYFLSDENALASCAGFASAALTDDALVQVAEVIGDAGFGQGLLEDIGLYYVKRPAPDGSYVAFADVASTSSWKHLALVLVGVGLCALAAFLVISHFLSRWALRPVEEAWARQRQFIADASHELKTPLSVIMANTAILRKRGQESVASQSQWVESTQTEVDRMRVMVDDMLELARLDDIKGSEEDFETVDLSDLVERESLQFESVAFEGGVELDVDIESDVRAWGNVARLQRMARTLIDNACKYAKPAGPESAAASGDCGEDAWVKVSLTRDARAAKLVVRNSGAVIDAEDLPHVFDRFYRTDKARTRKEGGYGLGLAIAREIVQEHGGQIAVASSVSEGTTFTITIPILR